MPTVSRPDVLSATYTAAVDLIRSRDIPTALIAAGHTVFRSVPVKYMPKPSKGQHLSKAIAMNALMPMDGVAERNNRFSGPSYHPSIHATGGLYCVLQQQALINEVMHYARRAGVHNNPKPAGLSFAEATMLDKCVLKIVLMRQALVADLSPHNPGLPNFLKKLEQAGGLTNLLAGTQYSSTVNLWQRMIDSDDCSVARGIGLAIANTNFLSGLMVETVRRSGRSAEERGDNLVLFGSAGQAIPGLYIEEAYYFNANGTLDPVPVQFP
jgi:hypothetical protein